MPARHIDTRQQAIHNSPVYRHFIDRFARDCVQRIARGEYLSDADACAFRTVLEARELSGHRLLGPLAGPDASFDTVSGRCGHRPVFRD